MKKTLMLFVLLLVPASVLAQGLRPFGSYTSNGFDTINNQNLNVYFAIPLVSSAGRGLPLQISLVNNSLIWGKGASWTPVVDPSGNATWGWQKDNPSVGGSVSYTSSTRNLKCPSNLQIWPVTTVNNFAYVDALGTGHSFPISYQISACPQYNGGTTYGYASDATGYFMQAGGSPPNPHVWGPGGAQLIGGVSTAVDINGNYVTKTIVNSTETDWKDSIGNTALKVIYSPNTSSPTSIQYQFLDGNGNYQSITLKLQAYNIKTNFACSGVTEYTGTAYLPYELDIPSPVSGTLRYSFAYEGTPNNSGYYTGRVKSVTLPTGGYYEWDYTGSNDGINCTDGTTLSMNRVVNDGTTSATWSFLRNTSNLTTTVTTPQLADTPNANDAIYTFNANRQEMSRKIYANSPGTTLWRTTNTTWATNGTPATQITILEDSSTQSEVATTFDSNGLLDSLTEYDFGPGAPGSPLRTTTYSYQTSSNYSSQHLINLVTSKVIKDGSGTVQYRQDIAYDGTPLTCPTGAAQHDDSGHPCTSNYRGNPTAVTTYTSPSVPSGGITKNFTYDWFGNLLTAQLNCCENKTWAYSATTQYSQPDSVTSGTSPTQLTTSYLYNLYLGLVTKTTDPNNLATSYSYDFLRRATQISQANGSTNGASTTYAYNDTTFATTTTSAIDATKSVKQVSAADGLGRTLTSTTEDTNSNIISNVSAKIDLIGRVYQTSNPYTGSPSNWTTTSFDVLGRPTSVAFPDTSATSYTFAEQYATVTDPAGKQRKSQVDGVGRLLSVFEPDINSGNSLTQQTSYAYNVLDELTTVTQGSQSRTYAHDALGRLLSATTPEGGTTCFGSVAGTTCNADGYDQWNNLLKRTDARGVLTSYGYDGLNRLTSVGYTTTGTTAQATASASFTYGTNATQFNNGMLITITDGVGSESYSYNALEQMTQLQKVISGTTYTTNYLYNIAGELSQIQYPSGRIVQQSVDAIGRLCEIGPSTTGCGTAANPYATGFGYNVASQLTGFRYGNGVFASLGYSPDRLQLTCLDYSTTNRNGNCTHDPTTKFGLTYSYGAVPNNNGQITSITDSVDNGRSVTYGYDPLYRLSTAVTTGSTNYPKWGLSWTYDRYGNSTNQTQTAGNPPYYNATVNPSTNRLTGVGGAIPTYDAGGNLTNDSLNTAIVYDAENHVVSSSGTLGSGAYTYDGGGRRVKKVSGSTTTVYIFSGSKVIAEYDNGALPGSPSREYVYGGVALLAKIDSTGTKYYHRDHLSNRLVTDSSGNTYAQMGHFPFGESWYNASNDKLIFTTYERDAESGNDYAQARYYVNRLSRFLSLDPLSGFISDPQSLNHYAYAIGDPNNLADPSGMDTCIAGLDCSNSSLQGPAGPTPCTGACGDRFPYGGAGGLGGIVIVDFTFSGYHGFSPDVAISTGIPGYYDLLTISFLSVDDSASNSSNSSNGSSQQIIVRPGSPHVDQKVLADCLQNLFSVTLADFQESKPGGYGYFTGFGPDLRTNHGNVGPIAVVNNAATYSAAQIAQIAGNPRAIGYTDPRAPYENYGNNNNNQVGTLVNQVHELGHSLFAIEQNSPLVPEPQEMGSALEDCVRSHHGFVRY